MNAHTKALAKLLQDNGYRHHLHDVFRDFLELAACAVSNAVDPLHAEEREARYLRTIGRYEAEDQARFPRMFAELVDSLEEEPGDVMGELFGLLEQGNAAAGQFFTPYSICTLMAGLTIGDGSTVRAAIADKGYVVLCEPASGAGAMVIAFAQQMKAAGFNYQQQLHVTAIDVDPRAVHMAYLQFSLLHIPAVVVLGNALALEERELWYTPAHILGGWAWRLRGRGEVAPALELAPAPATVAVQPDLFGAAA